MSKAHESPILAPHEGPAARVLNPRGASGIVLVCEHASRFIPASLDTLGLTPEAAQSHAAWDIGAMEMAIEVMATLDAPLVVSQVSRLVYDCNRPPTAPDAIPTQSERFAISGNAELSPDARQARAQAVYDPFRAALNGVLTDRPGPRTIVTLHSFTPVFHGQPRDVELGILHDTDDRLADTMLAAAPQHTDMVTARNAPYAAADGVTHTLQLAIEHGFANVMIEVRNDLIDTPTGVRRVAYQLSGLLRDATATLSEPHFAGTRDTA